MDKFEQAIRDNDFSTSVMEARDMLRPIINGEIERGHCLAGEKVAYGGRPGYRKTTLEDAVRIAKTAEIRLNKAINKFMDSFP